MGDIKTVLERNIRALRKETGWTQEYLAEKNHPSFLILTFFASAALTKKILHLQKRKHRILLKLSS
ncbi:hypothetical protein [Treponema sp.]|uniref:hypothetical protein n=1 Tax=Treponema sp. TaxID=166 RepID=UPI00257C11FE|nr:hypothetical protein [Treponema sp.]MBE6353817.1 hypothetical protein [Treponema sp.]